MPAWEIKSPLPLAWAGVRQLLGAAVAFSPEAEEQSLDRSCSGGSGKRSPLLMGEDGRLLQGAAGPPRWPC